MVGTFGQTPHEPGDIVYTDWQSRGTSAIVIGSTHLLPDGRVDVRFRLMDVAKASQITGFTGVIPSDQLRVAAHRIADIIYEALTGDVGVFSTRIAFVVKGGNKYALQIADSDGYNAQSIIEYTEPIISPAWSPDGSKIAYVSFENKKPVIYVQNSGNARKKSRCKF